MRHITVCIRYRIIARRYSLLPCTVIVTTNCNISRFINYAGIMSLGGNNNLSVPQHSSCFALSPSTAATNANNIVPSPAISSLLFILMRATEVQTRRSSATTLNRNDANLPRPVRQLQCHKRLAGEESRLAEKPRFDRSTGALPAEAERWHYTHAADTLLLTEQRCRTVNHVASSSAHQKS